jgi:hypothetical protein
MNKILPYVLGAILLGTVTMVVPYMLLGSSDNASLTQRDELIQPSTTQPAGEQLDSEGQAFSEDLESPPASLTDQPPAEEPRSEDTGSTFGETDLIMESLSNLSSIALISIPSFLIALGSFIYLKKWRP